MLKDVKTWKIKEERVGVDEEQFKLISICEMAKEAWGILQNIHEGPTLSTPQSSRCLQLSSKY